MSHPFYDENPSSAPPRHNQHADRADAVTTPGSEAQVHWRAVRYWFHSVHAILRGEFSHRLELFGTLTPRLPCTNQPDGNLLPNSFIEHAAAGNKISLRTGCVCNPGGAAAILGIEEDMQCLYPGVTLKDFEHHMGRELGVVRISLGLASNFQDVWRVLEFVSLIGKEAVRQAMWHQWVESKSTAVAL